MERERNPFATPFADWNGLGRRIGWITSQVSALQFKDLPWKENRSRSPLTRITSTLLSVTTALFGGSPFRLVVPPGNSCRAFRNHPANLRVPDSDGLLLQNSSRSIGRSCRSILCSKAATEKPFALRRGEYEPGPIVAGYRDLAVASSNQSATER